MSSIVTTVRVVKTERLVPAMESVNQRAPIITVNVIMGGLAKTVAVKIGN